MHAVRYDRFAGIDELYLDELPAPTPVADEVLVQVEAAALNPGALPALHGSSFTPNRDLAGRVIAVGAEVVDVAVGDEVLGWVQSWDAHAEQVAVPATQVVIKPARLSWDIAASLATTPMAGVGAWKAVTPGADDVLVISGASGGVGLVAAQYAVRSGARVLGLTSSRHIELLRRLGIEPVLYGEGETGRIRAAAGAQTMTAFIDAVGGNYLDLALSLDIDPDRINTVVDYPGARDKGVKALGTRDAGGLPALAELAERAASDDLLVPIGATYALSDVRAAYRALRDRQVYGKIVLHPQEAA
ncbi:NADP-dependent oxidoreductase [Phycicoccus sp. CMS6Z-2]|nr:NADP-dependent oxidoreductase [Phycicoccus flavus]